MKAFLFLLICFATFAIVSKGVSEYPTVNPDSVYETVYKGNKFAFGGQPMKDTISITDPITGNTLDKVIDRPFPINMNGKGVCNISEVEVSPQYVFLNIPIEEKILNNLARTLHPNIDDGILQVKVKQVIVDETGKVVYTDFYDIHYIGKDGTVRILNSNEDELFGNIQDMPLATYKGEKAVYKQRVFMNQYLVGVKDHTVTYHKIQ